MPGQCLEHNTKNAKNTIDAGRICGLYAYFATMEENEKPIIGITCGDLNGVGFEVIMKTLIDNQITEFCTPVVFATSKVASYHRKALLMEEMNFHIINSLDQIHPKKANLYNSWKEEVNIEYGAITEEAGQFALRSIDEGLRAWQAGHIHALVTAPVNKNNIKPAGKTFTGHTGYIGEVVGGEPLMILTSQMLRVALVTGHIAMSEVAKALSTELIGKRIAQLHSSLVEDFGITKPKIGVLALNPHAGDGGLMGNEEARIIKPAVDEAFASGKLVYGPYAADGYFGAETYRQFDATLAMYHDQGLIPFKALAFEDGVNFTAGLHVVRTSPDHGTGYSIAGKGVANEASFRNALFAAIDIYQKRAEYRQLTANPLKMGVRQREERG
jgi:4-hydroxythreonine-4-phosphate dehydrogenase